MPHPKIANAATPAALGYTMPAEWEPHAATWLGWPHNASDWPGKFEVIPWIYGEMIRKISAGEKSRLIVRHKKDELFECHIFQHVDVDLRKIQFVIHAPNRGWTRDTGPIFVHRSVASLYERRTNISAVTDRRYKKSETAIVHFHFNGWAKYDNWRKDTKVPEL